MKKLFAALIGPTLAVMAVVGLFVTLWGVG